jgi:hypothetical protein
VRQTIRSILAAAVFTTAIATIGCAGGGVAVGYRAYDPYRRDYHVWDTNEGVFYNQWVLETHRVPGRDYRKLRKNEQEDYWRWRHDHR